ncbi:MAG: hypothetical protein ACRDQY_16655 [Pseudonocardiaceae bacterium]
MSALRRSVHSREPHPPATTPSAELSPAPRAVDSPTLAKRLLIQTRGEQPVLAGVGEREQLLAARLCQLVGCRG